MARSQVKFNECFIHVSSSVSYIFSFVSFIEITVISTHLDIEDFVLLKSFKVNIRSPKASNIIEVIWQPLPRNCIKLNCGGASIYTSGFSACGDIARDNDNGFWGAFASFLGVMNSLIAELRGAMH
ncbi:unnamed protein product [Vicia faba]|uniref:Uncharacterized protein n=1 Tax=Vicia faba TaxID=3906 RepID=A0AAV1AXS2_VICFA|nr:unnamed protein product [Vicia faba]